MPDNRKLYYAASNAAVTKGERLDLWSVFPLYEVAETAEDTFVTAPLTVLTNHPSAKGKESIRHKLMVSKNEKWFVNAPYDYSPLEDHPSLFSEFAQIGGKKHIAKRTWVQWVERYGVLGLRDGYTAQNKVEETYSDFVREARLANRALRLFEAAANPDGLDIEAIQIHSQNIHSQKNDAVSDHDLERLEFSTLHEVRGYIEQKIRAECYLELIPRDSGWRDRHESPLARRWSFHSLLGAMWIQFMWLTTFDHLRYCKAPGCNEHIPPDHRSDRTTCSDRCRKRLERSL